jgi:hypothetical protein
LGLDKLDVSGELSAALLAGLLNGDVEDSESVSLEQNALAATINVCCSKPLLFVIGCCLRTLKIAHSLHKCIKAKGR